MTTLTLTKMKAGVLSIMNEADELFLMVSLINCRHFHSNLKNTTFEILKSSLKTIKQDSKTQKVWPRPGRDGTEAVPVQYSHLKHFE